MIRSTPRPHSNPRLPFTHMLSFTSNAELTSSATMSFGIRLLQPWFHTCSPPQCPTPHQCLTSLQGAAPLGPSTPRQRLTVLQCFASLQTPISPPVRPRTLFLNPTPVNLIPHVLYLSGLLCTDDWVHFAATT